MSKIPLKSSIVWSILAALFVVALFFTGALAWWMSVVTLVWFAIFETKGIISTQAEDTLSESVWQLLQIKNDKPVNLALYPLVMGCFAGAACLFIGIVAGAAEMEMSRWAQISSASFISIGTLVFLARHFWTGSNN